MKHSLRLVPGGRNTFWLAALALLGLPLAGRAARAQNTPPAFALATSVSGFQLRHLPHAGLATGNVYVTGSFTGTVVFGST